MSSSAVQLDPVGDPRFPTTQWGLVLAARDRLDPTGLDAISTLCRDYWFPVYAYLRGRTPDRHAACDLTQAFFTRVLERRVFDEARPERGRFRTFLLAAVRHFSSNEFARANAIKRGGGKPLWTFDAERDERRWADEPVDAATPEREFDRRWALELLQIVDRKLRAEYARIGKLLWYETLQPLAAGDDDARYADAAQTLGLTPAAARQAVRRLRLRIRRGVLDEIRATVATPESIEDELRHLFEALG